MEFKLNRRSTLGLLNLAFLICLTLNASASYITLTHTVTMERIIGGEGTYINVSLLNSGDEPANDVHMSLMLPEGIEANQVYLGSLAPGVPQEGSFNVSISPELKPGEYSMAILTEYKDANGYPLSAILSRTIIVKEVRSSQIAGMIKELTVGVGQNKKLSLEIINQDVTPLDISVRLFMPKQLKVTPMARQVSIPAQDNISVEFDITTFGALAGSNYAVYAALEYDLDGRHYSSIAPGMIHVVEYKEPIAVDKGIPVIDFGGTLPILLVILLIGALVVFQVASYVYESMNKKSKGESKNPECNTQKK